MRLLLLTLLTTLTALLAGCASRTPLATGELPLGWAQPASGSAFSLPKPPMETPGYTAPLRRTSAGSIGFDGANAAAFDPGGVTGPGAGGTFVIIPVGEDELAYAIFRVPLAADDRPTTVHCTCSAADDGAGGTLPLSYWIGMYNFSNQRWEWEFQNPNNKVAWNWAGTIDFDLNTAERRGRYCNRDEEAFMAIVVEQPSSIGQTAAGVQVEGGNLEFDNKTNIFPTAPLPADIAGIDASTPGQVQLFFGQGADDGDEIRVERREGNGAWEEIGTMTVGDTDYVDPTDNTAGAPPTQDRAYFYRARAVTIDGQDEYGSSLSNQKCSGGWVVTLIDAAVPGEGSGTPNVAFTSIAGINGRPAIAFQDNDGGERLKFAISRDPFGMTPEQWDISIADSVPGCGYYCSLAAVQDGGGETRPAIASFNADVGAGFLQYSYALNPTGANWQAPIILNFGPVANIGRFASLAVVGGNPAIACQSTVVSDQLWYVRAKSTSGAAEADWNTMSQYQNADTTDPSGYGASLMDYNGEPVITYFRENGGVPELCFVQGGDADGTSWPTLEVLDNTLATKSDMTSCASVNGCIAVAYHDQTGGVMKYAEWLGSPSVSEVDPNSAGFYCALAEVDEGAGPIPGIAYYHSSANRRLKYQAAGGGNWNAGTADRIDDPLNANGGGEYCDIAVVNGRPCISYVGWANRDLRFATYFQPH